MRNKMRYDKFNDVPKTVKINKIVDEANGFKSFYFDYNIENFKPGRFVMVWLPRLNEKPMGVSYYNNGEMAITVEKKGDFTSTLFKLKKGDKIGIRGPYGNGFSIKENTCIIGGGCGIAPLAPLAELNKKTTVILGSRSKDLMIFKDRFKNDIHYSTDDGTLGHKGFVTEVLEELLQKKKFDLVQCCGPEIMMINVLKVCEKYKIPCECSLERFMKCGIGVCGSCSCGKKLVCKDGPVFTAKQLKNMEEFGNFARTKSGKKVQLNKYHTCNK